VQCPGRVHREAGQSIGEQSNRPAGVRLIRCGQRRRVDPGVGTAAAVGDHQGWKGTEIPEIGIRLPDRGQRGRGRDPHRTVPVQGRRQGRIDFGEQLCHQRIGVRVAEQDPDIRQIRVDREPAIPGRLRRRNGGGDSGTS